MQDLKKRVDDWLFWYRSWYEIPNDYNKDIIEGRTTGLNDRAVDAANIIKELVAREERLVEGLKAILHEYERWCDPQITKRAMYERAKTTLKELGLEEANA